jgi:hypothetical protein
MAVTLRARRRRRGKHHQLPHWHLLEVLTATFCFDFHMQLVLSVTSHHPAMLESRSVSVVMILTRGDEVFES